MHHQVTLCISLDLNILPMRTVVEIVETFVLVSVETPLSKRIIPANNLTCRKKSVTTAVKAMDRHRCRLIKLDFAAVGRTRNRLSCICLPCDKIDKNN
ncbi:hypothetical protein CEXT_322721 [Caerostris extrusa]|uniref:Uncharacterized protein n=1 Tax=Caerostris extrusa TaxID=172846 RepID=A0AAV4MS70_CAEEX|nr:hypothetical protein CEXT_322721 [Caerostris extrusa]